MDLAAEGGEQGDRGRALWPWLAATLLGVAGAWSLWGLAAAGGRSSDRVRRLAGWLGPALLANTAALVALWLGRLATGTLP